MKRFAICYTAAKGLGTPSITVARTMAIVNAVSMLEAEGKGMRLALHDYPGSAGWGSHYVAAIDTEAAPVEPR